MSASPKPPTVEDRSIALTAMLTPPVDAALLEEMCRRIREVVDVEKIILFGSHAYGSPTDDSDVDLLVVADTGEHWHQVASRVHGRLAPRLVSLDVVVRTPRQIAAAFTDDGFDPFLREVCRKGKVLYERDNGHRAVAAQGE